ncbi:hypothetical protein EXIGLDRAFT_828349 [Exidia glandulosa HHB12029]|uniref:GED domain-containing protein n=1 Tax=Exidia glandulosa HHB12029 TaxID=1314781 RepID=A0A165QCP0_EXIGL|nr:hypothetical protein EXIGLDRAFT_828349 [Exidia glandulosa HHB12029]
MIRKRHSQPQPHWAAPRPRPAQPASPPPPLPPRSPSPVPVEEELPPRADSTRSWVDDQFERGRSRAPSAASAHSTSRTWCGERSQSPRSACSDSRRFAPAIVPTAQPCFAEEPPQIMASPSARSARSWGSPSVASPMLPMGPLPPVRPSSLPRGSPSRAPSQTRPLSQLGLLPAPGTPFIDVTKATKLLSSSSPFVQQYAAVRTCLDMLRGADLEAMDPLIPKVAVIGKDEPLRARIVAALTGVMVNRTDIVSSNCFCWKVSAGHIVDDETLNEVQYIADQTSQVSGLHQVTVCASSETDLLVYDFPFGSESGPGVGDYLNDRNTIAVHVGDSASLPPLFMFEFGARRSIYVPKADDSASCDVAVQQCFENLNQMLVNRLPDRVEALSQAMRKRVLELSKELTNTPAFSKDDNAPRLSNILTAFVDELKKALGASHDAHSALRQDVLATRREFTMPPVPEDAPTRAPSPAGSRGTGHGRAANHDTWTSVCGYNVLPPHSPVVLPPHSPVVLPPHSPVVLRPHSPMVLPPPSRILSPPGMWLPPGQSIPAPNPPRVKSPPLEPFHPGPPSSHAIVEPTISPRLPVSVASDMSLQDVMDRLDKARTNELPGHWPVHEVSSDLIAETAQHWLEPSESYLDALMKLVVAASGKSVDGHFASYTSSGLRAKVAGIVKAKILKCQQTTREVFAQVLEAEKRIAVEDDDAFLALKDSYRERFRASGQLSLEHLQAMGKCAATLDVMATVSAYFDVAHKRFMESLRRAAHTHLLEALTHDLASELMKAVDLTNAEKWVALPPETVSKRVELEDRLACLRRALDELSVALLL